LAQTIGKFLGKSKNEIAKLVDDRAVGDPLIFYEQLAALPVGWQTSVDIDVS
jgi:hypothetical protein